MVNPTCLFCGRDRDGRSQFFCTTCLPPHGEWDDKREYAKRYHLLRCAVGIGDEGQHMSRLPKDHPARAPFCGYRNCENQTPAGKAFGSWLMYCSDLCKSREGYERRIDEGKVVRMRDLAPDSVDCAWCFQPFTPKSYKARFCSQQHQAAMLRHVRTHRSPNSCGLPVCIECFRVFGASPHGTGRWDDGNRCGECLLAMGDNDKMRTLAKRMGDRPTIPKIVERDGTDCHICELPVDMDLSGSDMFGPTIDHILALSLGGTDTMDNVGLAHRWCNLVKSDKPVEEVS